MIAEGQTPPARLLKPSGSGSAGEFAPYRVLLLHYAKLDFSGQNKGDPLLVFQQKSPGRLVAFALTDHRSYASSDPARCRAWLWMHRDAVDWTIADEASSLLEELRTEFEPAASPGSRGRR